VHDVASYLGDVSLLLPGIALSAAAAIAFGARVGRAVGTGRGRGALILFGLGMILSATLTPSAEAIRSGAVGSGTCDLSRFGPPPLRAVLSLEDAGFNILLFLPLGIAIGSVPGRRARAGLFGAAFALSPLIELIQLLATGLDRACQSSDVFDNLTGLVAGLVIGSVVAWLAGRAGLAGGAGVGPGVSDR
jgi:hypothetical protein